MILNNLQGKNIILASQSPRRKQLLAGLELDFEVISADIDESYPGDLQSGDIALFLSKKKSAACMDRLGVNDICITADTIVWINDHVLNKPATRQEACDMLLELSGNVHTVYTGVTIASRIKSVSFLDETSVEFTTLSEEEIGYYIDHYRPFDKAGAYGVQELIGYIAIRELKGSYYNVMGLPVHRVYEALKEF